MISSISLQEVTSEVQGLLQRQATEPSIENLSLKHGPKSDHKSDIERQLEALEARLRTVQSSLEILTGACATLPDPEPDNSPDQDEDEEIDDGE